MTKIRCLFAATLGMLLMMPWTPTAPLALAAPKPIPSSSLCHGYSGDTQNVFTKARTYQATDWNDLLDSNAVTGGGTGGQPQILTLTLSKSRTDSWTVDGGVDASATIKDLFSVGAHFGLSYTSARTVTFNETDSISIPGGRDGYVHAYPRYMVYTFYVTRRQYGEHCSPPYKTMSRGTIVGHVVLGPTFISCIWDPKQVANPQDPCHRGY